MPRPAWNRSEPISSPASANDRPAPRRTAERPGPQSTRDLAVVKPRPGWVYILTNPAMPHLVKIGMTGRNPKTLAAELTRATGVPAPFAIAWQRAVYDCAAVEIAVHRLLADRRVSQGREFFRCDETMAHQVIEAAAGALLRP